ncbi:MAG: helix-turn-helix transcriptional regulator, partial [Lachnospira sp.]|nr:helix-turn-helix transcriptional regulator [Lachnospira sp.]
LDKFGERLGIGKSALSKIERGENNVTERMIKSICREFQVDFIWLTTGEGEMFHHVEKSFSERIDWIMRGENSLHIELIKWIAKLDEEDIDHIDHLIKKYLDIHHEETRKKKE